VDGRAGGVVREVLCVRGAWDEVDELGAEGEEVRFVESRYVLDCIFG
jgi:hypothetical protein